MALLRVSMTNCAVNRPKRYRRLPKGFVEQDAGKAMAILSLLRKNTHEPQAAARLAICCCSRTGSSRIESDHYYCGSRQTIYAAKGLTFALCWPAGNRGAVRPATNERSGRIFLPASLRAAASVTTEKSSCRPQRRRCAVSADDQPDKPIVLENFKDQCSRRSHRPFRQMGGSVRRIQALLCPLNGACRSIGKLATKTIRPVPLCGNRDTVWQSVSPAQRLSDANTSSQARIWDLES